MICGDAEATIGSTLTACAIPHKSRTVVNVVLVASNAAPAVLKGAALAKDSDRVHIRYYRAIAEICKIISQPDKGCYYVTVYLETIQDNKPLDLVNLLRNLKAVPNLKALAGVTIILDDRKDLGKIGPRHLGYLDLMESHLRTSLPE